MINVIDVIDLIAVPERTGPTLVDALAAATEDPPNRDVHLLAATRACLQSGRARHALRLLDEIEERGPVRGAGALRSWALQLNGNWYPGGVGAETGMDPAGLAEPPNLDDPATTWDEVLAAFGPPSLLTPRAVVEGLERAGNATAASSLVAQTVQRLEIVRRLGEAAGQPRLVAWALLAMADLLARTGERSHASALLDEVRTAAHAGGLLDIEAVTHLINGDWSATPGSSPEALGVDLAPQHNPSPFAGNHDVAAGEVSYRLASDLIVGLGHPRLQAVVALRMAAMATWMSASAARLRFLDEAGAAFHAAGDEAGAHLVAIHRLLADLSDGRLAEQALAIGDGLQPPSTGTIADIRAWASADGSRSWGVGLGRLLERHAEGWSAAGELDRARLAYLGAVHLLSLEPTLPTDTVQTAVAYLESRQNLTARAVVRLERVLRTLPTPQPGGNFGIMFAQQVEAITALFGAQNPRRRTAAALRAAAALDRLGARLDALLAMDPVRSLSAPTFVSGDDANAALAHLGDDQRGAGLDVLAERMEAATQTMLAMAVGAARQQRAIISTLGPLSRAEYHHRRGEPAIADQLFEAALLASRGPDVPPFAEVLILVSAERYKQARALIARHDAARSIPDDLLALLALRAGDYERASTIFARSSAAAAELLDWHTGTAHAEIELATGHAANARKIAAQAIATVEQSLSRHLRDPDRVAAADDPDIAALYLVAARCELALAPGDRAGAASSFEFGEQVRALTVGQLAQPAITDPSAAAIHQRWAEAAANSAAVNDRLLGAIDAGDGALPEELMIASAKSEGDLRAAEQALERSEPGALVRRTNVERIGISTIQHCLSADLVLLQYHTVGNQLLVWAVTADDVAVAERSISGRALAALVKRYHDSCAVGAGSADAAGELSALLLGPVAAPIRRAARVVVSPYSHLNLVPFHALPFDGTPLGLSHVVSYIQAARLLTRPSPRPFDAPITVGQQSLVIGDPAISATVGTRPRPRRRLPGALLEARVVAERLGAGAIQLTAADATEDAVRRHLQGNTVIHIAAHGLLDELAPYDSSVVLAGDDSLTVAELVGLRLDAELVVLSACDTGRGAATLGGDVVGLTRALLAAGVRHTVVSLWPVDDATACVTMATFYDLLVSGQAPAHALAKAQRLIHSFDADQLRQRYAQLLGQGSDALRAASPTGQPPTGRRDLLDQDTAKPPDASTESQWAPFILVGY